MIIEFQGENISIKKDNGEKVKVTPNELLWLVKLQDSLFGNKPTHAYISNEEFAKIKEAAEKWRAFKFNGHVMVPKKEYKNLRDIKEIGIELLDACKKTKETNDTKYVIRKFHDFKFAIFPKEKTP